MKHVVYEWWDYELQENMKYMTLAELVDIKGQLLRVACEDGHNACSWQITVWQKSCHHTKMVCDKNSIYVNGCDDVKCTNWCLHSCI